MGTTSTWHARLLLGVVSTALAVTSTATLAGPARATGPAVGQPAVQQPAVEQPTVELVVPKRVRLMSYEDEGIPHDFGIRLIARGAPLEIRSRRVSYDQAVAVTVSQGTRQTTVPPAAVRGLSGFKSLLRLRFQRLDRSGSPTGRPVKFRRDSCIGTDTQRVDPAAPATSPYPPMCYYNPYATGGLQGIQTGWAAALTDPYADQLPVGAGTYDVKVSLRPSVARALGVTGPWSAVTRVVVEEEEVHDEAHRRPADDVPSPPQPHRAAPPGRAAGSAAGPRPDLRALPAWEVGLSRSGKHLQFAATVWNGGDSPLVVDGFRRRGQAVMDAYQYFFDADDKQVGYQAVGAFEWDPDPTHQHWHFRDFASYTLLRADKTPVVASRKEAFCLVNTDAVDFAYPGADLDAEAGDLSSSCGDATSLSIREVLSAGWGDTYHQFRAGQSFRIADLRNGVYYIEVRANPNGNLIESDVTNNVSLRKVRLSGPPDRRRVKVRDIGLVEEPKNEDAAARAARGATHP